jgi:hypothetical protein
MFLFQVLNPECPLEAILMAEELFLKLDAEFE